MFIRIVEFTTVIIAPLTIAGVIYCNEIISFIFEEKWLPIVPIIQGFLIYSAFRGIFGSVSPLLQARGKLKPLISFEIIAIAILVTFGIYLTLNIGVMGIVIVSILIEILGSIIYSILLKREININILKEINRVIITATFMGMFIIIIRLLTEIFWLFQIILALSVYFLILYKLRKELIRDYSSVLKTLFKTDHT
jgi:O-antigen/teichoic acid export membrane protein